MTPTIVENLRKGQQKMTKMFTEFDRICQKYDLKYWCVGGTLIGAVRHKGWIPWDGDMDVHMLETDWDKFCEVADAELPTTVFFYREGAIGKIKDLYSCYLGCDQTKYHTGLQIDVFLYKETWVDDVHMLENYARINRGDFIYKDTGDFLYSWIFPLTTLPFENLEVYVPGNYKLFCEFCYGACPPPLPPVEKRFPCEGRVDPFNASPTVLANYKDIYAAKTREWFRRSAISDKDNTKPLHHLSGWTYLSDTQWETFVKFCAKDVDLSKIQSVFEGGCGVGAVLQVLKHANPLLEFSGIDICKEAVDRCTATIAGHFESGSVCDLSKFKSDSFDLVLSVCVLSYLDSLEDLKKACEELLRIAKPGSCVNLCVFTQRPDCLKSLRLLVPITFWEQYLGSAAISIWPIPLTEFEGRYNVYMVKK